MIIVEGADNVGKSTLITQLLALDPRLRLVHRDRYWPKKAETIATSYLKALLPEDGDRVAHGYAVADRLFASECIYGDLFRNGCRMSEGEHLAVRNVLASYEATIVHCAPPDETILASWTKRDQLYNDPLVIARAYREKLPIIFRGRMIWNYDWTSPHAANDRAAIVREHAKTQTALLANLSWWSSFPHGVGTLDRPDVIFIGEGPSPNAVTPVPFATGPAGDFLAWALAEAITERTFRLPTTYFTNAEKGTDRDAALLRSELGWLARRETIVCCLGKIAEEMVEYVRRDLAHQPRIFALPHPQFWRRFHWPRRRTYVTKLANILQGETP